MKKYMIWIALAALIIPALARGLWFYRGAPEPTRNCHPGLSILRHLPASTVHP